MDNDDSPSTVSPDSHDASQETVSSKQQRTPGHFKGMLLPALIGLISGLVATGLVAAYNYGLDLSSNSNNQSNVAIAWASAIGPVAVVVGLLVSIGLPCWWLKERGRKKVLLAVAFETLFILIALVISGFVLFHGNSNNICSNLDDTNCAMPD
jgi:formate hydrogenlyase subunit 3/multisubunit Na+/H+ antiporter MnhD subunit